jgi:hypothetical protein
MGTRSVHTAKTQWTSAVSISVLQHSGHDWILYSLCWKVPQSDPAFSQLSVPDSIALQAGVSLGNLNVCLSVYSKTASDVLNIAQTLLRLSLLSKHCTVRCHGTRALPSLRRFSWNSLLNCRRCSSFIQNFTKFVKWMWEIPTKFPLRTWVKRGFYCFDFHETRVRSVHFS